MAEGYGNQKDLQIQAPGRLESGIGPHITSGNLGKLVHFWDQPYPHGLHGYHRLEEHDETLD